MYPLSFYDYRSGFHQIDSMQLILILHQAFNPTEMCETLPSFCRCFVSKLIQSFRLILTELTSSCWSCVHSAFRSGGLSLTLKSHSQLSIHDLKFGEQLFDPAGLACPSTSPTPGLNTPRIITLNIVETRMWSVFVGFRKYNSCLNLDKNFLFDP